MRSPFVVRVDSRPPRRAARRTTGESLGWVRALVDDPDLLLRADVVALPPGERLAPAHSHSSRDELFFVLEGVVQVEPPIETAAEPVGPREVFVVPHGSEPVTLRCVGSSPAQILQVSAARGEDVVTYGD